MEETHENYPVSFWPEKAAEIPSRRSPLCRDFLRRGPGTIKIGFLFYGHPHGNGNYSVSVQGTWSRRAEWAAKEPAGAVIRTRGLSSKARF